MALTPKLYPGDELFIKHVVGLLLILQIFTFCNPFIYNFSSLELALIKNKSYLPRVSPRVTTALRSRSGLWDGFERIIARCGFQSPHLSSEQH